MKLPYKSLSKKVTPLEYAAILDFLNKKTRTLERNENESFSIHKYNGCLIYQEFKNNLLNLKIQGTLGFPEKTLELILASSGTKCGKPVF